MTLRDLRRRFPRAFIETLDKEGYTIYVSSMSYKVLSYEVKEIRGLTYVYAYLDY